MARRDVDDLRRWTSLWRRVADTMKDIRKVRVGQSTILMPSFSASTTGGISPIRTFMLACIELRFRSASEPCLIRCLRA